jgi:PPM family protein phosphatase
VGLTIVEEAGMSDVGRQRSTNEDAFYRRSPVFAVADGMGGAQAGEVASRLAIETFDDLDEADMPPEAKLEAIAKEANRRIYEMAQSDEKRAGMGCTFTAALVRDTEVTIGHVGDSRAYRVRDGELEQLTHDHSLVEELVRQGKLTQAEAEVHPQRSIITRALGPEPDVQVDKLTFPAQAGDVYLLCSDGLTGMVPDELIGELVRTSDSLEQAASRLIEAANENGGRDNITVVLFRVDEVAMDGDEDSQATQVGLHVDDVERALDDQPTRPTPTQETRPARTIPDARDATRVEGTLVLDREAADEARAAARAESSADGRRPPPRSGVRQAPRPAANRRRRRGLALAIALLIACALAAGLYAFSRQFYFVGTDDHGLVTLYRGLPYDLPLGLELYDEQYVSAVPAASIRDERRRERILDHRLRERGDAIDLVRQLERARTGS